MEDTELTLLSSARVTVTVFSCRLIVLGSVFRTQLSHALRTMTHCHHKNGNKLVCIFQKGVEISQLHIHFKTSSTVQILCFYCTATGFLLVRHRMRQDRNAEISLYGMEPQVAIKIDELNFKSLKHSFPLKSARHIRLQSTPFSRFHTVSRSTAS